MAAECGMKLYKTSVKEDLNVDLVFQHLAENYVKKVTWLTIIQTCTRCFTMFGNCYYASFR